MEKVRPWSTAKEEKNGLCVVAQCWSEWLCLSDTAIRNFFTYLPGWFGSRVVSVLDSGAEGPGFKSQPRRCRVTVLLS